MTGDPLIKHVAQPIVDATGIDPKATALMLADVFILIALTKSIISITTIVIPGIWVDMTIHVVGGIAIRGFIRQCARLGPATLLTHPRATAHVVIRMLLIMNMMIATRQIVMLFSLGIADQVPISLFRYCLDLVEAGVGTVALYVGVCRPAPPRRRKEKRILVRT